MKKLFSIPYILICAMICSAPLWAAPIPMSEVNGGASIIKTSFDERGGFTGEALMPPLNTLTMDPARRHCETTFGEAFMPIDVRGHGGRWGHDNNDRPAPVPEPSSLLLIGTGLLSLGFWARQRHP